MTPALQQALDLVYDHLAQLELDAAEMDREARLKWISQRIAERQFNRQGQPPLDSADSISVAAAECIFALSLAFDG